MTKKNYIVFPFLDQSCFKCAGKFLLPVLSSVVGVSGLWHLCLDKVEDGFLVFPRLLMPE